MSLYADYLKERLGDTLIEDEKGFAVYRFIDSETVYIVDIYTVPEFRSTRCASDKADQIVEIAKTRGCKTLLGTVKPSAFGSTHSLKVLLGYGMQLKSSDRDLIVFSKEIK